MKPLTKEERAALVHAAEQGVGGTPEDVRRYEATLIGREMLDAVLLHEFSAKYTVGLVASLCAAPDGLPQTKAAIQMVAEVWAVSMSMDFEVLYQWALENGDFTDEQKARAALRPRDKRERSVKP
jgi:hypothetical protein